jgi:hypothetical protein
MKREREFLRDTVAAATEIGYVLTFLLGLSFMSFFSVWTWEMQDSRGDVWMEQAMEENLDSVAAAVERADMASRLDGNITYAEPVELQDKGLTMVSTRDISAAGTAGHSGEIELAGIEQVWVVLQNGVITLTTSQPGV